MVRPINVEDILNDTLEEVLGLMDHKTLSIACDEIVSNLLKELFVVWQSKLNDAQRLEILKIVAAPKLFGESFASIMENANTEIKSVRESGETSQPVPNLDMLIVIDMLTRLGVACLEAYQAWRLLVTTDSKT